LLFQAVFTPSRILLSVHHRPSPSDQTRTGDYPAVRD
jgi:hypothetical protein